MLDLKKKALGGIKGMLEDRLAQRLKPAAAPDSDEGQENPAEEASESPEMEKSEEGLEAKLPPGADVNALSPEEQEQLKSLYEKMGC